MVDSVSYGDGSILIAVSNAGDAPAEASTLGITPEGRRRVPYPVRALEPGETQEIVLSCGRAGLVLPKAVGTAAYAVTAVADDADLVVESNEDDNANSGDVEC